MIEKVFSADINAPAARVWDEITRGGGPNHPMFGTYVFGDFAVGSVPTYRTRNGKRSFVLGEVLAVDKPRRLVHTFRFAMEDDASTLVTWELAEEGGRTRVTVTHSRFTGETRTLKSTQGGWPRILALYKAKIETGSVPLGARLRNTMLSLFEFMLPAKTRTEVALKADLRPPAGS
ncbi:MAG: SRPBCC domain-containing protein [Phycisphaerales bacterium]